MVEHRQMIAETKLVLVGKILIEISRNDQTKKFSFSPRQKSIHTNHQSEKQKLFFVSIHTGIFLYKFAVC